MAINFSPKVFPTSTPGIGGVVGPSTSLDPISSAVHMGSYGASDIPSQFAGSKVSDEAVSTVVVDLKRAPLFGELNPTERTYGKNHIVFLVAASEGLCDPGAYTAFFLPDVNYALAMRALHDNSDDASAKISVHKWKSYPKTIDDILKDETSIVPFGLMNAISHRRDDYPKTMTNELIPVAVHGRMNHVPQLWLDAIAGQEVGLAFKFCTLSTKTLRMPNGDLFVSDNDRKYPETFLSLQCYPWTNTKGYPRHGVPIKSVVDKLDQNQIVIHNKEEWEILDYYDEANEKILPGLYMPFGVSTGRSGVHVTRDQIKRAMTTYDGGIKLSKQYQSIGLFLTAHKSRTSGSLLYGKRT